MSLSFMRWKKNTKKNLKIYWDENERVSRPKKKIYILFSSFSFPFPEISRSLSISLSLPFRFYFRFRFISFSFRILRLSWVIVLLISPANPKQKENRGGGKRKDIFPVWAFSFLAKSRRKPTTSSKKPKKKRKENPKKRNSQKKNKFVQFFFCVYFVSVDFPKLYSAASFLSHLSSCGIRNIYTPAYIWCDPKRQYLIALHWVCVLSNV